MPREGFEAQAAGSRIKLFLIPHANVTISINYQGCSLLDHEILWLCAFSSRQMGVLGDDF